MEHEYLTELSRAESLHTQGKLEDALRIYQKLLNQNIRDPRLFLLYGTLLLQAGAIPDSEKFLREAVSMQPDNALGWNNLGIALQNLSNHPEAVMCFRRAISISPRYKSAYNNLGISLAETRAFDEAVDCYNKLIELGDHSASTFYNLGLCCQHQKKYGDALTAYRRALEIEPDYPQAMINMGAIYREQNRNRNAEEVFTRVLALDPKNIDAQFNTAALLTENREFEKAELLLNNILKSEPDYKEAINELGKIKFLRMELESALALYEQCISLDKTWWRGYYNCGVVCFELGDFNKSIEYLQHALTLDENNPRIHFALSESLLAAGDYDRGLKEYEYRLLMDTTPRRTLSIPVWQGEPLRGKKIFVYEEQGSGDTFQFIRYLELLKADGAELFFEVKAPHLRLIAQLQWIDHLFLPGQGPDANCCDYCIPLLSIPFVLRLKPDSTSNQIPYLFAPPELVESWRDKTAGNKIKAGIVWSGNRVSGINHKRHCTLQDLAPLFELRDISYYSLQVDDNVPANRELLKKFGVTDLAAEITDFADTAAIITNLDIIITIDTSVAHLAGAMGKETYILLAKAPDWRWQGAETLSHLYPSAVLLKQQTRGSWTEPIARLKEHLNAVLRNDFSSISPLALALSTGENYGWGVCSKYLNIMLARKTHVIKCENLPREEYSRSVMFHAVDANLNPIMNVRGRANIAYTFFESELSEASLKNSANFDLVLGGSEWNKEKLIQHGIHHSDVLIQGIDPELFYPVEPKTDNKLFVIFSGGKFELRKGQDLVLRAFEILHKKYDDIVLMNVWFNMWPATMKSMQRSPYIKFEFAGQTWEEFMTNIYRINNINPAQVITLPITNNQQLRQIYARSDVGLFPNRCEGGTNLVLMEYMACGRPVIGSYNSGHKDVLNAENSYRLMDMKPFRMYEDDRLTADWEEPALDEIISLLEYAYHHRTEAAQTGVRAGEFMKQFTWEKTADQVLQYARNL